MYLSFETNELSALDLKLIALVASDGQPKTTPIEEAPEATVTPIRATPAKVEEPVKDTAEEEAAKAAAKEAAKKAALAKKAEAEAEAKAKAEAAAAAEAEDLVGDEPAEPEGPTMADAVAAATKLVSSGGAPKVKEALAAVGAKRVSEIPADSIAEFLSALAA